jgi:hypothetical protein
MSFLCPCRQNAGLPIKAWIFRDREPSALSGEDLKRALSGQQPFDARISVPISIARGGLRKSLALTSRECELAMACVPRRSEELYGTRISDRRMGSTGIEYGQ